MVLSGRELSLVRRIARLESRIDRLARPEVHDHVGVAVYNNAIFVHNNSGNWLQITFNTERWDDAAFHNGVNPSRLTVPDGYSGWYTIMGHFRFAASGAGTARLARIILNGATTLAMMSFPFSAGATSPLSIPAIYYLSDNGAGANDYIELGGWQDTGGNLNVDLAANYSPEFRMVKI